MGVRRKLNVKDIIPVLEDKILPIGRYFRDSHASAHAGRRRLGWNGSAVPPAEYGLEA
jgi:hypothetical protein